MVLNFGNLSSFECFLTLSWGKDAEQVGDREQQDLPIVPKGEIQIIQGNPSIKLIEWGV